MEKVIKISVIIYILYILFALFYSNPIEKKVTYRDVIENISKCDPSEEVADGFICDTGFEHASNNVGYIVEKASKYNYTYYHSALARDVKIEYTLKKIVDNLSLYQINSLDELETCISSDKPIYEDDEILVFDRTCAHEYLIARDGIPYSTISLLYNDWLTLEDLKKLDYPLTIVNK